MPFYDSSGWLTKTWLHFHVLFL